MGILKEIYEESIIKKSEKDDMKMVKSTVCMLSGKSCSFGICDECNKSKLKSIKY